MKRIPPVVLSLIVAVVYFAAADGKNRRAFLCLFAASELS